MIRFRRRPGGFPQFRFPENPFPTMRFLPIASLCAFALCAGAADPTRFSLFRSDSDGEDGSGAGSAVFSLDDSAVTINLRPWPACADYWAVYSGAQEAVKKAFDENGVTIPFPQVDVHMIAAKA